LDLRPRTPLEASANHRIATPYFWSCEAPERLILTETQAVPEFHEYSNRQEKDKQPALHLLPSAVGVTPGFDNQAAMRGSRIDVSKAPEGMVTPPTDDQLYWYLGPQQRWVQLTLTLAFALAATSLVEFSLRSAWLYPLLAILGVSVVGSVLALVSGLNSRRISLSGHRSTIASWRDRADLAQPSVDIYLPCCGEDLTTLQNTFFYVSKMEWAGKLTVWVLDDGASDEVAELADAFEFEYIVRPDRGYLKKAGNLRHAFGRTSADFIVILDADFCSRPDFLEHTIPYMLDESVGIVQTPQFFDTKPSMGWLERTAGATQELFYRWVQPSRDRSDAAICVGTCAVYRRSALDDAGGFAEIEHSEDIHTGIALIHAGYVLRYVPVLVSRGLCPDDLAGFLNQQYRWCNGSLTKLKSSTPSQRKLSLGQRVSFWSGLLYYVSTALNVFVVPLPGMLMALRYPEAVRAVDYVPLLVGMWVYFVLMPKVSRSHWRYEVLRVQMAYSFCHAVALGHRIVGRSAGWVATGAVGKRNTLSRSVATVGAVTLGAQLSISWASLAVDIPKYGIEQYWPMTLFLIGYTFVAAPLLGGFVSILSPGRAKSKKVAGVAADVSPSHPTLTAVADSNEVAA
jgi:cellulose synthase (UDP-forming)